MIENSHTYFTDEETGWLKEAWDLPTVTQPSKWQVQDLNPGLSPHTSDLVLLPFSQPSPAQHSFHGLIYWW